MSEPTEPKIHSHITDCLDDDHPLAFQTVYCDGCKRVMLHASNNECMQTWVETGVGNYCIPCFAAIPDVFALDDQFGLPAPSA